jgi:hypothetical protein
MKRKANLTDGTSYPQPSYRTLFDMMRWWQNQSFAGDKGGSFNVELYIQTCKIKQYAEKENDQEKA